MTSTTHTIGLVTTWPPRQCGIAQYSARLGAGLVRAGASMHVIAEEGGATADPSLPVSVAFARGTDYAQGVRAAARDADCEVVHVQHAPDIFGMGAPLLSTLRGLREDGRRGVVTLHTVFTTRSGLVERRFGVRAFHEELGRLCHALIVHTDGSAEILRDHGVPASKVHVIPHGTDAPRRGDAQAGRALAGLRDDDEVVLFFGFLHAQKNIHVLIRALPALVRLRPRVKLVIAGKPGSDAWYNHLYLRGLRALARVLGVADRLVFLPRFISDAEADNLHAMAGVVALPHAQGYASASGVVHSALTFGLPLVCSVGPKFEEVGTRISPELLVPPHDAGAWARALARALGDEAWRAQIVPKVQDYAAQTGWDRVALEHLKAYAS